MRLGILPLPALLFLLGILQIPSRWGQGKQFYCRRVYEPELRLGGESVVYRIWGPPRKGPARVCTAPRPAAQSSPAARRVLPPVSLHTSPPGRNTAAGTSTSSRPTADPAGLGGGGAGGGAFEARAQRGGRVRGWGPRSGAALGPRQLRSRARRAAGPPQPGWP